MSELEKRREDENEGEIRIKGAAERKKGFEYNDRETKKREYENQEPEIRTMAPALRKEAHFREGGKRKRDQDLERELRAKEAALYKKALSFKTAGSVTEHGPQQIGRSILRGRQFSLVK
jgi:hypothetical protein